jgi:hypothetical protein
MRIERSVTTISWIPSEAITGLTKAPFEVGINHYDNAPPDAIGPDVPATIEAMRASDRLRFANHLRAWIEIDHASRVLTAGYSGGGSIGSTTMKLGADLSITAIGLPDQQSPPEIGDGWVRFTQSAGGRTGVPVPRAVKHPPFVQYRAPVAHTTLELTIHTDGRAEGRLVGASTFPRHWLYDDGGVLQAKSGLIDYKSWLDHAFGKRTPWGEEDSPAFVTEVETALERELSVQIMRGGTKPQVRKLSVGDELVHQGDEGRDVFLLLDGVLAVEVDGHLLAEVGPGSVLGERAVLEGGARRATLRATTPCRVAVAPGDAIDRDKLATLSEGHRREETTPD